MQNEDNPDGYNVRVVVPQSRDPVPRVRIPARQCRVCGSVNVTSHGGGSHVNAAGARVRYCICRTCGAKNIFVEG